MAREETSVGVNFVSDVSQSVAQMGKLSSVVSKLGEKFTTFGIIAGVALGTKAIFDGLSGIVGEGALAEDRLARLTTALQDVKGLGTDPATAALLEYESALSFAALTPFDVGGVVDSVVNLRVIGVDPLAESFMRLTKTGPVAASALTILGDAAAAIGEDSKSFVDAFRRAALGAGLDEFAGRLGMGLTQLKTLIGPGIAKGTDKFKQRLIEITGNIVRFQGQMDVLSKTFRGTVSNIQDFGTQWVANMAGNTRENFSFFMSVKEMASSLASFLDRNSAALMFIAKTLSVVLATAVKSVKALFSPVIAFVKKLVSGTADLVKRITVGADTAADKSKKIADHLKTLSLLLAWFPRFIKAALSPIIFIFEKVGVALNQVVSVFGRNVSNLNTRLIDVGERLATFWAGVGIYVRLTMDRIFKSVKKVMDYLGLDAKDIIITLALILTTRLIMSLGATALAFVKSASAAKVFAVALRFVMQAGIFLLIAAIVSLIRNWDSLTSASRTVRIALITLGATLLISIKVFGGAAVAAKLFGIALTIATGPIGATIVAVALLAAGVVWLYLNFEKVTGAVSRFWMRLKLAWKTGGKFERSLIVLGGVLTALVGFFLSPLFVIGAFIAAGVALVKNWDAVVVFLRSVFIPVWESVVRTFNTVIDFLVNTFAPVWDMLVALFMPIIKVIEFLLTPAILGVKLALWLWSTALAGGIIPVWDAFVGKIKKGVEWIGRMWERVKNLVSLLMGKKKLSGALTNVSGLMTKTGKVMNKSVIKPFDKGLKTAEALNKTLATKLSPTLSTIATKGTSLGAGLDFGASAEGASVWADTLGKLMVKLRPIVLFLKNKFGGALASIKRGFSDLYDVVKDKVNFIIDKFRAGLDKAAAVMDRISTFTDKWKKKLHGSGLSGAFNHVNKAMNTASNTMTDSVSKSFDSLTNKTTNLIDKMASLKKGQVDLNGVNESALLNKNSGRNEIISSKRNEVLAAVGKNSRGASVVANVKQVFNITQSAGENSEEFAQRVAEKVKSADHRMSLSDGLLQFGQIAAIEGS